MTLRLASMRSALGRWAAACGVGVLCAMPVLGLLGVSEVGAQSAVAQPSAEVDLPEKMALERQALAAQKNAVLQAEQVQQRVCWQKFAVNACLIAARRERRQNLEPLRAQELALNAQERLWRTAQREQRLQDKRPVLESQP